MLLVLFNGCGSVGGLALYDVDHSLSTIKEVRTLPMLRSIGFEWKEIKNQRIHGVNIYRGLPTSGKQSFELVGTVGNRYATHFVDTKVKPNTSYVYTFTTFSIGKESKHGAIVKVKTGMPLEGVSFVKALRVDTSVVKILWTPHQSQSINRYIVQRSTNNTAWEYITELRGQLMAEYIDTFVSRGNTYKYRIIAKSYDGLETKPSVATSITL